MVHPAAVLWPGIWQGTRAEVKGSMLILDVKDDKGNTGKWVGEGTSPNMLVREGWDRKTVKPGDQITATGHPARNGTNSMRIEKIVLPSGRELTFEGPGGT